MSSSEDVSIDKKIPEMTKPDDFLSSYYLQIKNFHAIMYLVYL